MRAPLAQLQLRCSMRMAPMVRQLADGLAEGLEQERLQGLIEKEADEEIRLLDQLMTAVLVAPIHAELQDEIMDQAADQKGRLDELKTKLAASASAPRTHSAETPAKLRGAVAAVAAHAPMPSLAKLCGAAVPGSTVKPRSKEGPVPLTKLIRLGEALAAHDWASVATDMRDRCLREFAELYQPALLKLGHEALSAGDAGAFGKELARYAGWQLPPLDGSAADELVDVTVKLAVGSEASSSLHLLDMARRVTLQGPEPDRIRVLKDDLAKADAIGKRLADASFSRPAFPRGTASRRH